MRRGDQHERVGDTTDGGHGGDAGGRRVARHGPAHADVVQALQQRVEILGARRQQVHPDLRLLADVHPGIEETVERRERQVLLQDAIGLAGGLGDAGLEVGNPVHDVVHGPHRSRRRLDGAEPRDRVLRLGRDLRDRYRPRRGRRHGSNGSVVVVAGGAATAARARRTTTSPTPLHPIGPMLPEAGTVFLGSARVAPFDPCRSRHMWFSGRRAGSAPHSAAASRRGVRDSRWPPATAGERGPWARSSAPSRCRSTRPAPRTSTAASPRRSEHHGRIDGVVNCVGSLVLKPAHLTTDDEWAGVARGQPDLGVPDRARRGARDDAAPAARSS